MVRLRTPLVLAWLIPAVFAATGGLSSEPVTVGHLETPVQGTLTLSAMNGTLLATGELLQQVDGDQVTSRGVFRFTDGSIQDETAVFTQRGRFRLTGYRLIQRGPAFRQPIDMTIDTSTGEVTVKYRDGDDDKVERERLDLPPDVANGIVPVLLKNLDPAGPLPTVSMVAATPRPRLVKLVLSAAGTEPVAGAGAIRPAMRYRVKAELGGLTGVFAAILGKQLPEVHVWIRPGDPPVFVRSEGPLFYGGDPWRIELTSPAGTGGR